MAKATKKAPPPPKGRAKPTDKPKKIGHVGDRPSEHRTSADDVVKQLEALRVKTKQHDASLSIKHWFPTGILALDLSINRGMPGGRLVELSGPEGCGKTTLALWVIRQAQLAGGRGDYFDLEVGITPGLVREMGHVDTDPRHWKLWRPDNAEMTLESVDAMIPIVGNSGKPSVIVIDSVPAIVPTALHKAEYTEDPRIASTATLISRFCCKNMAKLDRYPNVLVIFINHIKEDFKIGKSYLPPTFSTPGGRAMRFYPSLRIRFDKKDKDDQIAPSAPKAKGAAESADDGAGKFVPSKTVLRERIKMVLWKNRVGSSHREITLPLNFVNEPSTQTKKGFDNARTTLEFLRNEGLFKRGLTENGNNKLTWNFDGAEDDARRWDRWVHDYNTDKKTQTFIEDMLVMAARDKWAPELNGSVIDDIDDTSDLIE